MLGAVLLPPPIVIVLSLAGVPGAPSTSWAPQYEPAQLWPASARPVAVGLATDPPSGLSQASALVAIDLSARAWMLPDCTSARFSLAGARALVGDGANDGRNDVIVHASDWPSSFEPGALAQTAIYVQGGRIVEADVHVNARDHVFVIGASGTATGAWDLRGVLTHEFGHVLGIGHSTVSGATMNAGLPVGIAARSLEADDLAAICALYPVDAATTTIDCDRGGPACPAGTRCVGHQCEDAGEPGTLGAACAAGTSLRHRCDGVGDDAECVKTTAGEHCARACGGDAGTDCGAGLACLGTEYPNDFQCVPEGSAPIVPDAGADVGSDAGADADADTGNASGGASDDGCGCAVPGGGRASGRGAVELLVAALAWLTNRAARGARASSRPLRPSPETRAAPAP
jgi:hypothetical protein